MKDALKYLTIAHENDPIDFGVMLKLGGLYNILHDDREAIKWFDLASKSPDPSVSSEAEQAYHNLAPAVCPVSHHRLDVSVFLHAAGMTFRLRPGQDRDQAGPFSDPSLPLHAIRRRCARDHRSTLGNRLPQYLSESSFIFGVGVATLPSTASRDGLKPARQ